MSSKIFNIHTDIIYDTTNLYDELAVSTNTINWNNAINFDTLIGAIIGGTLALVGSIIVNKIQFKWQAKIERVQKIYTPRII